MKNYLLLFMLLSCSLVSKGQSICDEAISAVAGVNSLPATSDDYYWYTYTMPSDGKLQVTSSTSNYVSIYYNTCESLYYGSDGYGNATITTLSEGDEVFIAWDLYSESGFEWELSVVPLEEGDNCELAVAAETGTNTLSATLNQQYWYRYTMPSDGKLQITSSTSNQVHIRSNTCEDLDYRGSGSGGVTVATLSEGDEVFIVWDLYSESGFEWNLSVVPFEEGDKCEWAAVAVAGDNVLPPTSNQQYWYRYTMPSDGKLQITSSTSTYINIRSNTCDNQYYEGYGNGNAIATDVSEGDEVFIIWNVYGNGDFEWNLSVAPLEEGDKCELAVAAETGSNTLPTVSSQQYWYRYTMPSDGKLQITSSTSNYLRVYSNTCDAKSYEGSGSGEAAITTLNGGDELLIAWSTYNGGDFEWNLSVVPLEAGDNCELAVAAETGMNMLPTTSNQQYWYRYTMPSDGKLQITTDAYLDIIIYSSSCGNLLYQGGGYREATVATLDSGDEVLISWQTYNGGNFEWDLSVLPLEEGESCRLAVAARAGVNTVPPTSNPYYWYSYTMPDDGRLQISSTSNEYVQVYDECDTDSRQSGSGNIDELILNDGDKVFIKWQTNRDYNLEWILSVTPLEPGESCPAAVAATNGTNSTSGAPYWFEYTVPANGNYTISSVGLTNSDTYLKVYSDCSRTLLDRSDDFSDLQSEVTLGLVTGETIYILWDDNYSSEGFDWTISSDASTKTNQTITFDALPEKTLADATFDLTASASSGLPVSYASSDTSVATVSGSTVTIVGVGTTTITASQAGNEAYNIATPVERVLTVNKVDQTITVNAIADQQVDADPIAVSASTTSGLSLSYAVDGPATMNGNEVTLDGTEGTVQITVSQAGDDYYQAASRSVSFFVTDPSLQDQSITFDPLPTKELGDDDFTLAANASSSLLVIFSSSDESVATVAGSTVTIVGAGTTIITAYQAGSDTYRAASATQVLTVESDPSQSAVSCANIAASITETANVTCHGSADGSFTVLATGGKAPYRYSTDGTTFQEEAGFTALRPGEYTITVKDADGCTATVTSSITAPDALVVVGEATAATRSTKSGSIALSISGGTAPYRYVWSNEATTATISDLALGDYNVTVTDAAGCTATASFTVEGVTAVVEEEQPEILLFPNPAANTLYISVPVGRQTEYATIYNSLGSQVATVRLTHGKNQVDVRALKAGSYVLRLDDGSARRVMIK